MRGGEPAQPDPQPVLLRTELQAAQDRVDRLQPVLDLLDRGGHRPGQRHEVLAAPLGEPTAPLRAPLREPGRLDLGQDPCVVGARLGGGAQVGVLPLQLVGAEDGGELAVHVLHLHLRGGDGRVQPGVEAAGVLVEPGQVLWVLGGAGGRELLVQTGQLLLAQHHPPDALHPVELVADLVLGLDHLAVLGVQGRPAPLELVAVPARLLQVGTETLDLLLEDRQPVVGAQDRAPSLRELLDPLVAGGHVQVVEAVAADRLVGGPAQVEQPGGLLHGREPGVQLVERLLDPGQLLVDLGQGVAVAEADDAALLAGAVGAAASRAGLAGQGHPQPAAGQVRGVLDAQGVAGGMSHVLGHPAPERRVLEQQLAGHVVGVRRARLRQVELGAFEGEPTAQGQRVDRAGEVVEPVQRHQHQPGRGAQHGLDGGAPPRLPGSDVDQLGDERQLGGAEPAGPGHLVPDRVQVGGHPPGPALQRGALLAQGLAPGHQRVARGHHLVALGDQSRQLGRVLGQPALGAVDQGVVGLPASRAGRPARRRPPARAARRSAGAGRRGGPRARPAAPAPARCRRPAAPGSSRLPDGAPPWPPPGPR